MRVPTVRATAIGVVDARLDAIPRILDCRCALASDDLTQGVDVGPHAVHAPGAVAAGHVLGHGWPPDAGRGRLRQPSGGCSGGPPIGAEAIATMRSQSCCPIMSPKLTRASRSMNSMTN